MPEIDYFYPAPRTRRRDLTPSETSGVHRANCFNPYQRYLFQPMQCCRLSLGTDHAAALIEPYFSYLSGLVPIVAGGGNWKPARLLLARPRAFWSPERSSPESCFIGAGPCPSGRGH